MILRLDNRMVYGLVRTTTRTIPSVLLTRWLTTPHIGEESTMNAFFCRTPYQVIAAIAMGKQVTKDSDIYISNTFSECRSLAEELRDEKLFHGVYFVDTPKLKIEVFPQEGVPIFWTNLKSLVVYLINMLTLDRTVGRYLHTEQAYQRIYITSNAMDGRFAILHAIKHHRPVTVVHSDDGIGSYSIPAQIDGIPLYDRITRYLLLGKKAVDIPFEKQLYCPKLYTALHGGAAPQQIPSPIASKEVSAAIEHIFHIDDSFHFHENVVILDTIPGEVFRPNGILYYQQLLQRCNDLLGAENIVYKKHPRDAASDSAQKELSCGRPFEAYCFRNDLSSKILITDSSTATFTPKLLFGQEPTLLILYALLDPYHKDKGSFLQFAEVIRSIYREPEKVIIPRSEDELNMALKKLKGNLCYHE